MSSLMKQLSVFLENKPGLLAKLCKDFTKNKINILALTVSDTVDHAVVRMIVDKPREASYLIEETGAIVIEKDVLVVELNNQLGELSKISEIFKKNRINIEYLYCSSLPKQKKGMLVIRTKQLKKAQKVIQ